ncbi:hypothetical protein F66182_7933 [Fusarium sp. NRRL 66182]|nr:hypothetical protein F66182_7933 [Fusarium sp. NRRL 66182]
MPSTEYFGYSITNLGPLTTTYTPPPSCITATADHIVYAIETLGAHIGLGAPTCESEPFEDCIPSGAEYDDLFATSYNMAGHGWRHYYSPGLHCPHGWTTAGVLAPGEETGSDDKGGFFTRTNPDPTGIATPLMPDELWSRILGPSETVAYCCPSGWDASLMGCLSFIEPVVSATHTGYCTERWLSETQPPWVTVHTIEGTPVPGTAGVISHYSRTGEYSQGTAPISQFTARYDKATIARTLPIVPLVYQASDAEDTATQTATESDAESDEESTGVAEEDSGESEGEGNAASTLLKVGRISPVVAVLVGVLTGAGLLMPW